VTGEIEHGADARPVVAVVVAAVAVVVDAGQLPSGRSSRATIWVL
jgi:hypothetical protein